MLREILWKALKKKVAKIAYIQAIKDMCERVVDNFLITIGLHQESTPDQYICLNAVLVLQVLKLCNFGPPSFF